MNVDIYDELPPVLQLVQKRGFKVFQDGDYDMNIVACRRLKDRTNNAFDDVIHFVYKKGQQWIDEYCSCTTDAGTYWLTKTDYRKDGVAILIHDQQARGAYKIGRHKTYEALEQIAPVAIWRDNNFNDTADYACSEVHKGIFKCNIHKAGTHSTQVNKWSAGCIVIAKETDFLRVMHLAHKQVLSLGYRTFTLTLLGCDYGSLDN